jgi:molybdenum cofactor cytidylyltransferase
MISAVVLAAGESRRMGRPKLLLSFGDHTIIEHVVEALTASALDQIIVVTGHNPDGIAAVLRGKSVAMVHNAQYQDGMLSSVRAGLRQVAPDARAVLLVLGDQPSLQTAWIAALIASFAKEKKGIHVPVYQDRRGHPLLFAAEYIPEILAGFDDEGLRGLLRKHADAVHEVAVSDEEILADMDTPEDYARALSRLPITNDDPRQPQ